MHWLDAASAPVGWLRLDGLEGCHWHVQALTWDPGAPSMCSLLLWKVSPNSSTWRYKGSQKLEGVSPAHRTFQVSACIEAADTPLSKSSHIAKPRVSWEELPKGMARGRHVSLEAISAGIYHKWTQISCEHPEPVKYISSVEQDVAKTWNHI